MHYYERPRTTDTHETPNFAGDKAVAGERQTVEIPEHAQSGHLFQFFGDFV